MTSNAWNDCPFREDLCNFCWRRSLLNKTHVKKHLKHNMGIGLGGSRDIIRKEVHLFHSSPSIANLGYSLQHLTPGTQGFIARCMSSSDRTMIVETIVNLQFPALFTKYGSNVDVSHLKIRDHRLLLQNDQGQIIFCVKGHQKLWYIARVDRTSYLDSNWPRKDSGCQKKHRNMIWIRLDKKPLYQHLMVLNPGSCHGFEEKTKWTTWGLTLLETNILSDMLVFLEGISQWHLEKHNSFILENSLGIWINGGFLKLWYPKMDGL